MKCDRSFAPRLLYPRRLITTTILLIGSLAGSLTGCTQSLPEQSEIKAFNGAVGRYIETHAEYGYSEAEIYLTFLANIPAEAVYEFGDRACETLRRGGSQKQIIDIIQSRFSRDDQRMTYLYIAKAAEESLCPTSLFPTANWRRSLFFWQERLNGGQPL